jgi:hypothetical protein
LRAVVLVVDAAHPAGVHAATGFAHHRAGVILWYVAKQTAEGEVEALRKKIVLIGINEKNKQKLSIFLTSSTLRGVALHSSKVMTLTTNRRSKRV